jgi:glycosyltransferase involved in cell wall biosynthesis
VAKAGNTTPRTTAPIEAPETRIGVNVVGFFRAEFGQGEAARRLVEGLMRAGIPYSTVTYGEIPHRQDHPFEDVAAETPFGTNILCLNAEHVLAFAHGSGTEIFADRYSIGVWFWEASRFVDFLRPAFEYLDEIWVASTFVAEALCPETWRPIVTFPLPVEVPPHQELSRHAVGLPSDRYVFLFVFDFYSTIERKNPVGLIEAFKAAFASGEGPVLFLKTINGDKKPNERARVERAIGDRSDIVLVDGFVPSGHVRALTALCDCYVSLHRSEGFGLTIAEAMAYGKPAIATRYSGNLTFMDDENSYLVPHGTATVPENTPPYPAGAVWADPDIGEAGRLMRHVYENQDEARERGERGRQTILTQHSLDQTAAFLRDRLGQVERLCDERNIVPTAGMRARSFLVSGPSLSWEQPTRRFGRLGVAWRRLLLRLLRPYLVRQREWETHVTGGLQELEAAARFTRDRIDQLERRLAELERMADGR